MTNVTSDSPIPSVRLAGNLGFSQTATIRKSSAMVRPIQELPARSSSADLVTCNRIEGPNFGCRWHFHQEYELTLVEKGGSHRWVGDKIVPLKDGDLTFLGPNLPHEFRNEKVESMQFQEIEAINIQFHPQFLGQTWLSSAEMTPVHKLLQHSCFGLEITGTARERVAKLIRRMPQTHGMQRLMLLMQILDDLSRSEELTTISSPGFLPEVSASTQDRLGKVLSYIRENYHMPIYLGDVARHVGISEVTFSQYFRSRTGKTFPTYLNEFRISRVCRMLAATDRTIGEIAWECGFDSMANFLKQFKRINGCSPTGYRDRVLRRMAI